jgi:hypothetical protein
MTSEPYNPLAKINLGKSVAEALLEQPAHPLAGAPKVAGAGIYALYYTGDAPVYEPIARANQEELRWPIYVGKAVPSGARRGASLTTTAVGEALWKRLAEHRRSIAEVERAGSGLRQRDFLTRHLVVDDIWIPLGESLLISRFRPLWNAYLDGFGNHAPGAGRYEGEVPLWDTLHPGRAAFQKLRPNAIRVETIEAAVREFLRANRPPDRPHMDFTTTEHE